MKNQLEMQKTAMKISKIRWDINEVNIWELRQVKWFWESTLLKLKEKGISSLRQLYEAMQWETSHSFQDVLTPIQFKQAQNYFVENPYKII